MSIVDIVQEKTKTKTGTDRRTFRWKCWFNGKLEEVVITPPAKDEKNVKLGGVRGRIYHRQGESLKTIPGVVHQDGEGRTYFIASE